jgi:hypothetical protein
VSIFQLEETKQGETKFQLHNMGQQAEAKYAFVVSLASFLLFFFLSSFNQIDSCRGGGGVFTLVTIPKYSICADLIKLVAVWGETFKKFISFEVEKIIFYFKRKSKPWMHLISS